MGGLCLHTHLPEAPGIRELPWKGKILLTVQDHDKILYEGPLDDFDPGKAEGGDDD